MTIRCDKSMRRSKERTIGLDEFGIVKWRCTGNCDSCICGLKKQADGTWVHVGTVKRGVVKGCTNAFIADTEV